jgi:hypothetical protein
MNSTSNIQQSKMKIADFFRPQTIYETRRMYHDSIAREFAQMMSNTLHADAQGWAVYHGNNRWSYQVLCGDQFMCWEEVEEKSEEKK